MRDTLMIPFSSSLVKPGLGASRGAPTSSKGFTGVELAVTVAIVALLVTLVAPSFRELIAGQRVQTAAMEIYTGLIRARSEALKQNTPVTLSSSSGTNWAGGWTVTNGATDFEKRSASAGVTITGSASAITYQNSGRTSVGQVPSFAISATGTAAVRCVKVNPSGQPYVTKTNCS